MNYHALLTALNVLVTGPLCLQYPSLSIQQPTFLALLAPSWGQVRGQGVWLPRAVVADTKLSLLGSFLLFHYLGVFYNLQSCALTLAFGCALWWAVSLASPKAWHRVDFREQLGWNPRGLELWGSPAFTWIVWSRLVSIPMKEQTCSLKPSRSRKWCWLMFLWKSKL